MSNPFLVSGRWYRGNTHTHTSESDATWSVADCCEFYRTSGYDFLGITDHWHLTDARAYETPDFLMIPGCELNTISENGVEEHVLGLGVRHMPVPGKAVSLQEKVDAIRASGGLAVVAHPEWSGQTAEHLLQASGVAALEVFNTTSEIRCANGLSDRQWDEVLRHGGRLWGVAGDDTHVLPGFDDRGRAWIHVRSPELTLDAVLAALARGHFWSTTGPELRDLRATAAQVMVRCSPCRAVRFIVDGQLATISRAAPNMLLTEATAPLPSGWHWFRVECIDGRGGKAWSNPLFS